MTVLNHSEKTSRESFGRALLRGLTFALIYVCVDLALNKVGFDAGWTILWPLNGVTVAVLLMRPRREWPSILVGVGVGTGIGECVDGNTIQIEIWLRLASVLEILLAAWVLPAFTTLDQWLRKPRLFLSLTAALVVGPGVSGVIAAVVFHVMQHQSYLVAFNEWATADAIGIMTMLPLALAIRSAEMRDLFRPHTLAKTLIVLVAACLVGTSSLAVSRYPLLFLIFPTLLVVDLTLSFSGAAIAAVGVCFTAMYMATHGIGIFGVWHADLFVSRDFAVQCFLGFQLLALFPASILIRERRTLVAELNTSNAKLRILASLDGLTGICNRRTLDENFAQEWKRAIRLKAPLTLIMLDVDHFKQFNDRYGHSLGDECLKAVAKVLTDCIRRPQDTVARFGGEEFALLLPHTDSNAAHYLAETIRRAISDLKLEHADSLWKQVTVSLGCSTVMPALDMQENDLFIQADAALYEAKRMGRNRVQTWALPEMEEVVRR